MSEIKEDRLVKCMFYMLLGKDFSETNYHWKYLQSNSYGTAYDSYPSPDHFVIITTPLWIKYSLGKVVLSIIVITIFLAGILKGYKEVMKRMKIRKVIQSKKLVVLENIQNSLDIANNMKHNAYQPIKTLKVKKNSEIVV
jgi:hypothetical protein